ncbi:hypothetical protein OESDEN_16280 [Oesophagostomum dentatum]|uniref:Uncharacterized protein n=1 Tax=Oesophagostomum dentatum TaxID=61180 RepID=A0A0B1SLA9_OESDE|nr:hypothetical protein OESDEN_16280 [Oesophagostomum dentatum]
MRIKPVLRRRHVMLLILKNCIRRHQLQRHKYLTVIARDHAALPMQ